MITLAPGIRTARLAVISNALDAAVSGGVIQIYTEPRPAEDALADQVLLAEIRLPKPCVLEIADGVLSFAQLGETLCVRSGTAAWARLADGNGKQVADLDVGLPGSGADVELSGLNLLAGGTVTVNLAELRE